MFSKSRKNFIMRALLLLLSIAAVMGILYYSGIIDYITLEAIHRVSTELKQSAENNYAQAMILYLLVYILLVAATLPVVGPLAMLGGYLFGLIPGFCLACLGAALGSTLSFIIIRYALSSLIRKRYKKRLEKFNEKIKVYGYSYLLTMQLLSVIPYVVINTLAALTDVSILTSFWTTLVGSAPLLFMYVLAGRQMGTLNSAYDIFSPQIILLLLAIAAVSVLLPKLVQRFKHDHSDDESEDTE